MVSEPSPPMVISASMPCSAKRLEQLVACGPPRPSVPSGCCTGKCSGVAPVGGAEDGAAEVGDAAHTVAGERDHAAVRVLLGQRSAR